MKEYPFVFGVDLDGVCADYTSSLAAIVESARGLEPGTLPPPDSWGFSNWDLKSGEFNKYHTMLIEGGGFASMAMIDGAAESLQRLSDIGVWIRIITHRLVVPHMHGTIARDTVTWLDTWGIPYRDICFLGDKQDVRADLYVDDAPHNVLSLRQTGADVLIFDQPYNRELQGSRAKDWGEVEEEVYLYTNQPTIVWGNRE